MIISKKLLTSVVVSLVLIFVFIIGKYYFTPCSQTEKYKNQSKNEVKIFCSAEIPKYNFPFLWQYGDVLNSDYIYKGDLTKILNETDYQWGSITKKGDNFILKPLCNTNDLESEIKRFNNNDEFINFLQSTEYIFEGNMNYSNPMSLLQDKKGDCCSYSLVIGYYLTRYKSIHNIDNMSVDMIRYKVTDKFSHIYPQVIVDDNVFNCDYTTEEGKNNTRDLLNYIGG